MSIATEYTFNAPATEVDRYNGVSVGTYISADGAATMLRFSFEADYADGYELLTSLLGCIEFTLKQVPHMEQRVAQMSIFSGVSFELERPLLVASESWLFVNDWRNEAFTNGKLVTPSMARHTLHAVGKCFGRYYDADQAGTLLPLAVEFSLVPFTA